MTRIGIYAGTFDPVHNGHIKFALLAIKSYGLEKVVFLPEKLPRFKTKVSPLKHRIAMLRVAIQTYKNLEILELPDEQFSVSETLPKIRAKFAGAQLFLLVGSDVSERIQTWPGWQELLKSAELVVAPLAADRASSSLARQGDYRFMDPKVVGYIEKHDLYDLKK